MTTVTHRVKIKYATDVSGLASAQKELNKMQTLIDDIESDPIKLKAYGSKELENLKRQLLVLQRYMDAVNKNPKQAAAIFKDYNDQAVIANRLQGQLAQEHRDMLENLKKQDKAQKDILKNDERRTTLLNRTRRALSQSFLEAPLYSASFAILAGVAAAVRDFIEMDKVLTRISIVTGRSAESMEMFAKYANNAGKALGVTGKAFADASLTFLQQGGIAADYATQLAEASIKLSNITGTQAADTSEYVTAIANSFKVLETEGVAAGAKIVDMLAAVEGASGASADAW